MSHETVVEQHHHAPDPEKKAKDYRLIFMVAIALGILTLLESAVAAFVPSAILLMIIAFVKAGIVVNYFMHVYRLWRDDAH